MAIQEHEQESLDAGGFWCSQASELFRMDKPEHFTNHEHCDECAEHDQTLLNSSIAEISMKELGNPGWDPICFASAEGTKYYMPALIRLCFETLQDDFYFAQLLFHLEIDGPKNELLCACDVRQRKFIHDFVEYMLLQHTQVLEDNFCGDDALRVLELWAEGLSIVH